MVDAYQRVGLGRLLLETLMLSALESGVAELVAHVLPDNVAARRLFERAGAHAGGLENGLIPLAIPITARERREHASGTPTGVVVGPDRPGER